MTQPSSPIHNEPLIEIKEGLQFDLTLAVREPSTFIRYVLKEHLQAQYSTLVDNPRKPPRSVLINALYDEIASWLDTPSMNGLVILDVGTNDQSFASRTLTKNPQVTVGDIVEFLSLISKRVNKNDYKLLCERMELIQSEAKRILSSLKNVKANRKLGNE